MKALHEMLNVDKAALLHSLFPNEIPELLEFMENLTKTYLAEKETHRAKWGNPILSFDQWLGFAEDTQKALEKYGRKMRTNRRLFTDQLFDGYIACYTNHCLQLYADTHKQPDSRFVYAIRMLYNI